MSPLRPISWGAFTTQRPRACLSPLGPACKAPLRRAIGAKISNGTVPPPRCDIVPSLADPMMPSTAAAAAVRQSRSAVTRLFGAKRGVPGNPPGEIAVYDEQTALPDLDVPSIERTISDIRDVIGYPTYDVSLILTDDEEMRQTNMETRGVDAPTDILSFPFQDVINAPGDLGEPEFDLPDYYNLGDMMLDVPYVLRRIDEDRTANEGVGVCGEASEEEEEGEYVANVGDDDRGVSGAMATEYDPEVRIQMLLVHGMLHLVGYDHIEDDDYEVMVTREEEVLRLLEEKRTGD